MKTEKKKALELIYHEKDENVPTNFNKYKTFENWAPCFEKVVQQYPLPHTVHCAICANGGNTSEIIILDSMLRLDKTHKPCQLS